MMKPPSSNITIQPIISFVSFTIIGIVLAITIFQNSPWKVPVIFLGLVIGGIWAYFDLKRMIRVSKGQPLHPVISKEKRKLKLAKQVAELFDDDIPFEEDN
ncbi:MAG: hypothetical protein ACXADH_05925 [Candidatus Kariarchaeaceae archaeon]